MQTYEFTLRGLRIRDMTVSVPLDWADPSAPTRIDVFAREIAKPGMAEAPVLLFLQGGPGGKGPRPTRSKPATSPAA